MVRLPELLRLRIFTGVASVELDAWMFSALWVADGLEFWIFNAALGWCRLMVTL